MQEKHEEASCGLLVWISKVDITTLISKMRDQYHSLRQHYEQQLEDIEQAFEEERKEMLQKNKVGLHGGYPGISWRTGFVLVEVKRLVKEVLSQQVPL